MCTLQSGSVKLEHLVLCEGKKPLLLIVASVFFQEQLKFEIHNILEC